MTVDTGFDDVLAGEVYAHPEPAITVAVTTEVAPCDKYSAPPAPVPGPAPTPASPPTSTALPTSSGPVPSGLTSAGVQAAKALVSLPALSWPDLSKLAREIAMDIKEKTAILQEFKLNDTQYEFLEAHNEFYKSALAEACRNWHAPLSTQERIKVEAAAILEDSLLGLGARMQNKGEGLPGVIEAAKLFAKVAGVGEREGGSLPAGERFTINIDLGGDQKISVSTSPVAPSDAGGAFERAISANREAT